MTTLYQLKSFSNHHYHLFILTSYIPISFEYTDPWSWRLCIQLKNNNRGRTLVGRFRHFHEPDQEKSIINSSTIPIFCFGQRWHVSIENCEHHFNDSDNNNLFSITSLSKLLWYHNIIIIEVYTPKVLDTECLFSPPSDFYLLKPNHTTKSVVVNLCNHLQCKLKVNIVY